MTKFIKRGISGFAARSGVDETLRLSRQFGSINELVRL